MRNDDRPKIRIFGFIGTGRRVLIRVWAGQGPFTLTLTLTLTNATLKPIGTKSEVKGASFLFRGAWYAPRVVLIEVIRQRD